MIDALLATLSLEEKVAQLSCAARCYEVDELRPDADREPDATAFIERFPHGIGQLGRPSVGRTPTDTLALTSRVQQEVQSRTTGGIGVLFNEEGVHGLMGAGATVFPAALGLAATWDRELLEEVYTVVALEARERGSNYVYAPVLDVARDPRWGRVEETFGEDPFLIGSLGVAAVHGLQGREFNIPHDRVLACAKHFVGHGVPQSGRNSAPVQLGPRELRTDHALPFAMVIDQADVGAIMAAYHDIDGIPVHGNEEVLVGLLRDELGFEGMVTSDGFGIPQLRSLHRVVEDAEAAARLAFTSGVDCEVPEARCSANLASDVRSGVIDEAVIDRACRNVLRAKHRLALLEPYIEPLALPAIDPSTRVDLTQRAAELGVVLLTNNGVLPLSSSATIAVSGPNAEHAHLGGYTDPAASGVSILDGIRERFGSSAVTFTEGCRITDDPAGAHTWWLDAVTLADPALDDDRIRQAVAEAAQADIAVVVVGGNEATHREGWWFDHLGDRADLTMAGRQDELVERIAATGVTTIAVVVSGGPVGLERVVKAADAVLWTCYPGERGGTAIARVLAGDVEPGGRLPITFPRHSGQIPIHRGRRPSAHRPYFHSDSTPLFAFGHGLGYTSFSLTDPRIAACPRIGELEAGATVIIAASLENTGDRSGSEVVRVEVEDQFASVAQPARLVDFTRVALEPGQLVNVQFELDQSAFRLLDRSMTWTVEPGAFTVRLVAGGDSLQVDIRLEE
ncbi:MAG: beta-glucosidase [Acidimicrobiales bacterium]|nr:MAG: beta-glucosidase [Acidimicrobiales bacterium]